MSVTITKDIQLEDLAEFFNGTFPDHHPSSFFESRVRDQQAFVAKSDQDVTGFLVYSILWGNTPIIELIKVKETHQRNGIGTKLLQTAIEDIKERVPYSVLMSSSEVINDMGNAFHEKMGFTPQAVVPMYHGEERFYSYNLKDVENA